MNEYTDYFSKLQACSLIQALFEVTEVELAQHWTNLIKFACMELTKVEMVIMQSLLVGNDVRDLQLKRHVVYKSIECILKSSQESHKELGNILNFSKFFLCSLSQIDQTPKTII